MMIRELLANRICKGKETERIIDRIHSGFGHPNVLGYGNKQPICTECNKCFNKTTREVVFSTPDKYNMRSVIDANNKFLRGFD